MLIASYIAVWRWPPLHAIVRIPIWFFFSLLFFIISFSSVSLSRTPLRVLLLLSMAMRVYQRLAGDYFQHSLLSSYTRALVLCALHTAKWIV